mmetsp:Transcript_20400/g.21069  ORF Transcript_20400/g.21069 Transcript_20400/m.21069 type:complete len:257 (+) Transcript_20400:135-905(+)
MDEEDFFPKFPDDELTKEYNDEWLVHKPNFGGFDIYVLTSKDDQPELDDYLVTLNQLFILYTKLNYCPLNDPGSKLIKPILELLHPDLFITDHFFYVTKNNCICKNQHVYQSEDDLAMILKDYLWNNLGELQTNTRFLRLKSDNLDSIELSFRDSNNPEWKFALERWDNFIKKRMERIQFFEFENKYVNDRVFIPPNYFEQYNCSSFAYDLIVWSRVLTNYIFDSDEDCYELVLQKINKLIPATNNESVQVYFWYR